MQQILFLHGGDSFSSHDAYINSLKNRTLDYERLKYSPRWREWIASQLPSDDILTPTMPNGFSAQYDEWVIYFEKILPFLTQQTTLVGHSLGGMFLAKYFNTHTLPQKIRKIILIAAAYGDDEDSGSFAVTSAIGVDRSTDEIHLFHSKDDTVVPYSHMAKFKKDLPSAIVHSYSDRGHFNQASFPEFLELVKQG